MSKTKNELIALILNSPVKSGLIYDYYKNKSVAALYDQLKRKSKMKLKPVNEGMRAFWFSEILTACNTEK
jgi:hypothetical protein